MKKTFLIIAIFFASLNLYGAKVVSGPDENGRLYNTAYFDIETDVQPVVLGSIKYSKRAGFDWSEMYKSLDNFTANSATYKISGRIEIPKSIKTKKVYVTLGENIKFWKQLCCTFNKLSSTDILKANSNKTRIKLSTFVNGIEMLASSDILTETKNDNFGSRYVEFEIKLIINVATDKDYSSDVKARMGKIIRKFNDTFKAVKIQVAPKSRSYKSKWVSANIYVMDDE